MTKLSAAAGHSARVIADSCSNAASRLAHKANELAQISKRTLASLVSMSRVAHPPAHPHDFMAPLPKGDSPVQTLAQRWGTRDMASVQALWHALKDSERQALLGDPPAQLYLVTHRMGSRKPAPQQLPGYLYNQVLAGHHEYAPRQGVRFVVTTDPASVPVAGPHVDGKVRVVCRADCALMLGARVVRDLSAAPGGVVVVLHDGVGLPGHTQPLPAAAPITRF